MAKCQICHSCLTITRVDLEKESRILFYCDLCDRIFDARNGKVEVNDLDLLKKAREFYFNKYGYEFQRQY